MNRIIQQTLLDFTVDQYEPIFHRDLSLGDPAAPRSGNLVTVITGMRRSGKTYRLLQQMKELHAQGVPYDAMLYFNFEDDRLAPITSRTGDEVLEAFYALHPDRLDAGAYLFLDELQEMEGWGQWMRRVVDTRRVTVFVTGSSSRMLSSDIASGFRGRSIALEQLPLSFSEYVRWHGARVDMSRPVFSTEESLELSRMFAEYLVRGGFPAVQDLPAQRCVMLLQSYAQQVVARDVVERHDVGSLRVAAMFSQVALGANGRSLSLRKTENDLRSRGVRVSRSMLSDMLGWLEDAFLLGRVRELSRAASDVDNGVVKIYAIDPGLAAANAPASVTDEGQRLEGAVYLELRRRAESLRRGTISYLRTAQHAREVDFVLGDALFGNVGGLYQVTRSLADPKTRRREVGALVEALQEHGLDEGMILVQEGDPEVIEQGSVRISCIPAWEWMLGREA